jgi:hypothetical protein
MFDYTERLKKYWHLKDLSFVSTLHKINDNQGYFNRFINPTNGMELFYPEFDELKIEDKRVSFIFANAHDFNHGEYCKIRFGFTNEPEGINNPYSLEIVKVDLLDQNEVQAHLNILKGKHQQNDTIYIGRYQRLSDAFCVFENVMQNETGDIFMQDGEAQKVFVSPREELICNNHYSFRIKENLGKLPNAVPISITNLNVNPYQDIIRLRFERLNNPEANKMIANLVREIGKGMYSSKQRMIFELIQNADDAPGKEKVEFHIDINGDYFFVMHDGAPFNKDDVDAITSAAESTKRNDKKKTGYKGIGFKSVFTDSTEVWLKSGGYQFAFIRNSALFKHFETFYFTSSDYKEFPKLVERHRKKYKKDIQSYNSTTDIPWQVIPIWQDKLPSKFSDSNFNNFNNPVQFALKVGNTNIYSDDGYLAAIENIVKRPQFLLFLRNTSKFRSPKNRVTITRTDRKNLIKIEKVKVVYIDNEGIQQQERYDYTKQIYTDIQVSDEAFITLNIGIRKSKEKNDLNEDTYHFEDLDGNKIETIPPKLASATETEISFGISLQDKKISPEKEYIKGLPKYSSLFTYLPMEDTRFQLPFLVNADFVPSSDRQKLQGDNLWNKYIMINVAEKHIVMLTHYAQKFINDNNSFSTYLSLLLKELIPEDDTAQQIIDSYNHKYLERLNFESIIVNDENQTQLLSETILDTSGLIELFGNDIFYEIIEIKKRLPNFNLDSSYLENYNYLEIEIIDLEKLAKHFNPEICERLGEIIAEKKLHDKSELLKWLNKLVNHIPDDFGRIPFIVHNNSLFSLVRLVAEDDAWLINKNTIQYEELIKGLGFHTVNLNLDEYSNINNYLLTFSGYINDKTLAFERIATNSNLPNLPVAIKLELIDFFQNSEFMVGIGETKYFGELELFIDEVGNARPLRQLISRQEGTGVTSIQQFRIIENEFNKFSDNLKKELITKDEVFSSFILTTKLFNEWSQQFNSENIDYYVDDLKSIFTWVDNEDKISSANWASIPWLFVGNVSRFLSVDKVYWSSAFNKMSSEDYNSIKSTIHQTEQKTLPLQECGQIIETFKLKTDDSSGIDWSNIKELKTLPANTLLDWLGLDGDFSNFFEEYSLKTTKNGSWSIEVIENTQIFDGSEKEFKTYIKSNEELKLLFTELDESLCSDTRDKIGLLQGEKLLKAIIESKVFDQNLAMLLPSSLSWEQLNNFISNLPEFNLKTGVGYISNSSEHIIIHHLIKAVEDINAIPEELQNSIEKFREKININLNPLCNYDLSDTIQFGKGEDKKVLKLSDVVEEYKEESNVLDELIESFISIKEKAKLRKLIFKTRRMPFNEICSKIEAETSTYYTVHQVVFQLLLKKIGGQQQWSKQGFNDYLKEQGNETQLHTSYKSFLDVLFETDSTDLSEFSFHNLNLENCVDKNYAIDSEIMPQWLEKWINIDQIKRIAFVTKLGYNGTDSPIVKLRQNAISEDYNYNKMIRYFEESKPNMQTIWNSIIWFSRFNSETISKNIGIIKQINDYIKFKTENLKVVTIPIIDSISRDGNKVYILKSLPIGSKLYLLNDDEEFAYSIFTITKKENENTIFIDGSCGNKSSNFNTEVVKIKESIDEELLKKDSKLWDEPFYLKWEYYAKYPICVYNGNEIPYLRYFNGITINKYTSDLKIENDDRFYVSSVLNKDILNNLPTTFPPNMLANLKEWHYNTLQNVSLLDEDSFNYNENIDRLLQDRLGISEEDQKEESANAKTHAVYFLYESGFNVLNVNRAGAALTNIIDPDGNQVDCIVRSAKGGLLYLDKEHWDMLEDNLMYLIVIYPGNSPRLFKDRLELLEEELAENVLFRVPNNKHTSEIDGVFDALESESHLILVTSKKMKESLFSKLKQRKDINMEKDAAVGDDNYRPD